ncbi:MAG: GNAT family N-acetyltransferase [Casimicrobiaceae bacterium]
MARIEPFAQHAAPGAVPCTGDTGARMAPDVRWQWLAFQDLSPHDLYAALALRAAVFVVEQGCAFLDPDGWDAGALHLLGWDPECGASPPRLIGYLRVLPPGLKHPEPVIGRVITAASHRRRGLGRLLMIEGMRRTRAAFPRAPIRVAAQQRLERFYASLGFAPLGPPYVEDDLPHVDMVLPPGR